MSQFWQGFFLAVALLLALERVRWAQKRIKAFGEPQSVVTKTATTPRQVYAGCQKGFLQLILWGTLFMAVVWAIIKFSSSG